MLVIFAIAFSASYSSFSIDNLAFVIAIGIDNGTNDNLKFSFQFTNPSPISDSGGSDSNPTFINTVETYSIDNAINIMNAYLGKQLNLSHCKIVVFSESVAFSGIEDEIYTLVNNIQVRPSTNIIVSKCDAYSYIKNSRPSLETLTSKYYEIFPGSSSYTGYTYNATIGDFLNNLVCETCECYAILGGLSSSSKDNSSEASHEDSGNIKSNETTITGKRGAENIGLAVFKNGYLVGELNATETLCFSVLKNEVKTFLITVPDPYNNENYLDIYIYPKSNVNVKVDIVNGSPYIKLFGKFEGKIVSMKANSNYLSEENLNSISESVNTYLTNIFYNYLYKTSKEFKSDINSFGQSALSNFLTIEEMREYKWIDNYQNSTFNVNFESKVQSSFMITKS